MFAFDLDGTVTEHELLPLIAAEVGLQTEIRTLTNLTLNGTIGFEESLRLRVAILRSIPISTVTSLIRQVPLNQDIAEFIEKNRDKCCIVTGNLDVWIAPIIERLGCKFYTSVARASGDRLISLDRILHKSEPIRVLKEQTQHVIAIGESVNDVPMFEAADVGIAFAGVHPPSRQLVEISDYVVFEGKALCRLLNTL